MNDLIFKTVVSTKGVLLNTSYLKPIRQIKLKDIFECDLYLYVHENKVYVYPFENSAEYTIYPSIDTNNDIIQNGAYILANFFYNTAYYKIRFKELNYSKNADQDIDNIFWNDNTYINVYSYTDITPFYSVKLNNVFDTIRIVCNLLYKIELDNYIDTFKIVNLKMC